ncbi:MAG: hypothetical protein GY847_17710 [Proteobacteria bacterium]|nr:hypothetical protein [Pseudomonadota bacterium]
MRVFILSGAPRRGGYTCKLLDLFCTGVLKSDAKIDRVELSETNISPCLGCFTCWAPNNQGKCVQNDDMSDLIERYTKADILVIASPLYFYSLSSHIKIFLERMLPLTEPKLTSGPALGLAQNALRNPELGPKRIALIAVGAHRDPRCMNGVTSTFDLIADGLGLEPAGMLLRQESFFLDFPAGKPKTTLKIHAAFEKAGQELVTLGHIRPETEKNASLFLSDSPEAYERYFSVYWQIAEETQTDYLDHEALKTAAKGDLRILMPELADCLDQSVAGDMAAVFLFDLDGDQPGPWQLAISNGKCHAVAATHDNPSVTIRTSSETLLDIFIRRKDPRRAISRGELRLEGDKKLFARFERLFPPPSG